MFCSLHPFTIYTQNRPEETKTTETRRKEAERAHVRPSEAWTRAGAWSYLRRWHMGNGSGRSSLCCSSPRWRLPPGSGNISERKGEVRRVSTPDSALSLQAVPRPHWSDVACVLVVAGGVVNFQLPLTGHKGRRPRSQDSGRTTELLTNKPNRTRVGQAARPWPFRSPPRQMPARPLLSFPPLYFCCCKSRQKRRVR